jgi:dienelactone hydrolase
MKAAAVLLAALVLAARAAVPVPGRELADAELNAYFRCEAERLANHSPLADLNSAEEWKRQLAGRRQQLRQMLGIDSLRAESDLKAVITARVEHDTFTVENLHFQSLPKLYVTGNLYVPKNLSKPAPTILYVCGHGPVITNGISYGNKVAYQHHGAWFAQHGYVCLIIDTVQLGEIQGLHHGTYRAGLWWWNSRGYTPAGVETWNGMRALDYLSTRPEVDTNRFGITGRSGGGAYSWFITAVDDRIKAAAPVAGITDLEDHVVDGCVEGHCDCMFFVNTYRWDYDMLAALAAPRPTLLCNTDSDTIFPLDGVTRIHRKLRQVYRLLDAPENLGLVIAPGPHKDTQDLQMPVLRWFDKHLRNEQRAVDIAATKYFSPEQLRVFKTLPPDAINTNIADFFVPTRNTEPTIDELKKVAFAGWPTDAPGIGSNALEPIEPPEDVAQAGQWYRLESQRAVGLLLAVTAPSNTAPKLLVLRVAGTNGWTFPPRDEQDTVTVTLFVRGVGPLAWRGDARKQVQIRRRFTLLGQTVDGMRVWDIRRAIQALRARPEWRSLPLSIQAEGAMAANARLALLFEPGVKAELRNVPRWNEGPDYLNLTRVTDLR